MIFDQKYFFCYNDGIMFIVLIGIYLARVQKHELSLRQQLQNKAQVLQIQSIYSRTLTNTIVFSIFFVKQNKSFPCFVAKNIQKFYMQLRFPPLFRWSLCEIFFPKQMCSICEMSRAFVARGSTLFCSLLAVSITH